MTYLLQHPDIKPDLPDYQGQTRLSRVFFLASSLSLSDVAEIVQLLLERDEVGVYSKDLNGWTPINLAARKRDEEEAERQVITDLLFAPRGDAR